MSSVTLTPATAADFVELADRSFNTPAAPPTRVLALAGKIDGRVIAIGGISFWPNGVRGAFADVTPEARKHPIALHKAALATIELARKHKVKRLTAVADAPFDAAERWLLRLGFKEMMVGEVKQYVLDL